MTKQLSLIAICTSLLFVSSARAQEADDPAPATQRTGYMAMKPEDFPRDANGFLKPEVWDIIATEAKTHPISNDASVLKERPIYQAYYATFAKWKAPAPLPITEGRLRNLPDPPKEPRFVITDKVWPAKAGEASICLWEDDKLAAMSLGIDDNNAGDIPYWKELSKKYHGLNITWNLITCNIDGVVSKGRVGSAGTWDLWNQMVKNGFRVESHSMTHNHGNVPGDGWPGPDWEAAESAHMIDSHIPGYRTRIYAYPGAGVHAFGVPRTLIKSAVRPALIKYYVGARGGGGDAINQANMIDYFDIHSTTGSVPKILDKDPDPRMAAQNLYNLFDPDPASKFHKNYRGWANVFIHFINNEKDFEKSTYNVAYEKVLKFYDDNRDKLWTGYFADVTLYAAERDTATLKTDEAGDSKIAFTLTSKMEPTIYDYPLTVKVRLPDAWKSTTAKQKDAAVPVEIIDHEGAKFALVKAVPDRGQVVLTPVAK